MFIYCNKHNQTVFLGQREVISIFDLGDKLYYLMDIY